MHKKSEIVVVTGASAGVGRAIAHAFAARGARLGLIARGKESLEECRREVEERGGEALVLPLDVADADSVERAADAVMEKWGAIDIWVNNAMVSVFSPVVKMTPAEYRRVTEVTYLGTVHGTLAALRCMRSRDRGRILQIGSALAYRSIPLQSAYCAAKHAVLGFSSSLRSELLHDKSGVSITMLELPAVNTPQFRWVRSRLPRKPQPVPPIFQPELIAEAVVHASRTGQRELIIGWPAFQAIWANKLVPDLADRYLARTNYEAQQTDEPADPRRRDNLYHPIPSLASTHGDFDSRALSFSLFYWAGRHWPGILGVAAGAAFLGRIWMERREQGEITGGSRNEAA